MRRASEIVGKSIMAADTGERLGRVADVLVDTDEPRIVGLIIDGGMFGKETLLPYAAVETLGRDAVVTRSGAQRLGRKDLGDMASHAERSRDLQNRRVVTSAGRQLGAVSDICVDEKTGQVESLEVASRGFGGLTTKREMVPTGADMKLGRDVIVVSESTSGVSPRTASDGPDHSGDPR